MISIVLADYDPQNKLVPMRDECKARIKKFSKGFECELLLADEKGVNKSINSTINKLSGEWIILMGNDVMINDPEWINKLCVPKQITGWKWTTFNLTQTPELEFSLVGFSREVWNKVGDFDEFYDGGYGYDDNDWLYRARQIGIKQEIADHLDVNHLENMTHKTYRNISEFGIMNERNRSYFIEKWGKPKSP